jgi:hypothetical protein
VLVSWELVVLAVLVGVVVVDTDKGEVAGWAKVDLGFVPAFDFFGHFLEVD